jgi:cytochrome c oxidase accessory protein FixG
MKDLDPGKLTSVDEKGDRLSIIPAEVSGYFHRHRERVQMILLAIFLALPWTHVGKYQTIQLNIPDREFSLFGILFRSHDAPLVFFIFGILTLGLAFVTAIWGRVWCGWACPQTVFIEVVYRRIERWVEGTYLQRRALRTSPWSFSKFRKLSLKWFLFFTVSSLIAHSFLAYFVGANELIQMMQQSPSDNLTYFFLVTIFTAVILFDFAWFREQFCVIMCPYGRIQSLLLDSKSLVVAYDQKRGEPRRSLKEENQGDCVSCNRCVQVCPTGIDIRNGLQMECIACTACMDACDEIMTKVKKPQGLIRYDTVDGGLVNFLRPRVLLYLLMIVVLIVGLSVSLISREPVDWTLMRSRGLPYSFIKSDQGVELVLNQFKVHIQNQGIKKANFELHLPDEWRSQGLVLTTGEPRLSLEPDQSHEWMFFITAPTELLKKKHGQIKLEIRILDSETADNLLRSKELILVGPAE